MKNIRVFYLKNYRILEVKFSIYLNRRVFGMSIIEHSIPIAPRGRPNKPWQTGYTPQTKETQTNQHPLPEWCDHNARQDLAKPAIRRQRTEKKKKKKKHPQRAVTRNHKNNQHKNRRLRTAGSKNYRGFKSILLVPKLNPRLKCCNGYKLIVQLAYSHPSYLNKWNSI